MKSDLILKFGKYFLFSSVIIFFFFAFSTDTFAANRYWVGSTDGANFNSSANWSTTSGGAGGASVPGSADVAIFDTGKLTNSALSSSVTLSGLQLFTGYTKTLSTGANSITITGSSTVSQGIITGNMTFSSSANFYVNGDDITVVNLAGLNLTFYTNGPS
jgi:hypothetical protein